MTNRIDPILIERASEQLRQERETFDQRRRHDSRWFQLRLTMGYISIVLLAAIMVISSYVLFNPSQFSKIVVTAAGLALFVDALGLLIAVWKIVLNPASMGRLNPVTNTDLSEPD